MTALKRLHLKLNLTGARHKRPFPHPLQAILAPRSWAKGKFSASRHPHTLDDRLGYTSEFLRFCCLSDPSARTDHVLLFLQVLCDAHPCRCSTDLAVLDVGLASESNDLVSHPRSCPAGRGSEQRVAKTRHGLSIRLRGPVSPSASSPIPNSRHGSSSSTSISHRKCSSVV